MELSLPVVCIVAENLAAGWEQAVLQTWERGARIATQYDKPGDPESRDCSLFLAVADPFTEPRIHRAMPGGFDDLEVYRQEVVDGIHDHWIDGQEGHWTYSYHERVAAFSVPGIEQPINQLEYVVQSLADTPHTRRAQCVIWKVWIDAGDEHCACLQRLWFRIFDDRLLLAAHMRSNDAYKAAFMNMYAFTDLQRRVAEEVSERLGRKIEVGQYNHIVDSFHIYGSYFEEFKGFLGTVAARTWEQRTYHTPDVQFLIDEARVKIAASLAREREAKNGG